MSRLVRCRKYRKDLPGLAAPPWPGSRGEDIYRTVSRQAWEEWQALQTMLINEKHLNMMDPAARKYLQQQMDKFLNNEEHDRAEGYVAPASQPPES